MIRVYSQFGKGPFHSRFVHNFTTLLIYARHLGTRIACANRVTQKRER